MFCEKTYWDKNKYIEDGYSTTYDKIVDAFESIGVDVIRDGEVGWKNMSVNQIKNTMESNGINLLIDSPQFIREYTEKFGEDPRDANM